MTREAIKSVTPQNLAETKKTAGKYGRKLIDLNWENCRFPLFYMLSLALMGLQFPPGYLLVFALLIHAFRTDRYQFVLMLALFAGGYGFINSDITYIKLEDLVLLGGIISLFLYRIHGKLRVITLFYILYCLIIIGLSLTSEESFIIQFRLMRHFFLFIFFIFPVMCFSGQEFDMDRLFREAIKFAFLLSCLYVIDVMIFNGRILIPNTYFEAPDSRFWRPDIHLLSFSFPRKNCAGLVLAVLSIYPLARFYTLKKWQLLTMVLAVFLTKTFLFIGAVFISFAVFQPNRKLCIKLLIGLAAVLTILYIIDPEKAPGADESPLRIRSSIDQFTALNKMEDEEDLAAFASGRMAQAIPKLQLMYDYGKEWTGIGFIHPTETKLTKYIIDNTLLRDVEKQEEAATAIECFPLNTFLQVGYIGVVVNLLFYLGLYLFIRKWKYSGFYLCTAVCCYLIGLGGVTSWGDRYSLFIMAIALAACWLNYDRTRKKEAESKRIRLRSLLNRQ